MTDNPTTDPLRRQAIMLLASLHPSVRAHIEAQQSRLAEKDAEIARLRDALQAICRPRFGLQGIDEDHGHDANAFNFHAKKYWYEVCAQMTAVARAALYPTTEQEGEG